jgi:hypothetical protein
MLRDLISDIRVAGPWPILLATHLPLPSDIQNQLDYFIYEKDDKPSEDYTIYYHYQVPGDLRIKTKRSSPYHALSGYTSLKSSMNFLRKKYRYLHYIQYDTIMRIPEYIEMATKKLKRFKFVGAEYRVPGQKLSGLVGTFFSCDIRWWDDSLPDVSTWDEYKSYGHDEGDNLMGENWLYNLFSDRGMIPSCYFLSVKEFKKYILVDKIQTRGNLEPGLQPYLSELEDHRLILFVHLYSPGKLNFTVDVNGRRENIVLNSGMLYWKVIDKSGYVKISSAEQSFNFVIDKSKEYTDTVFKFNDNRMKCLRECDG